MRVSFKRIITPAILLLTAILLVLPVSATDKAPSENMPDEYVDFLEGIPEDIRPYLPDGLFSTDGESVEEVVREMSDFSYLFKTLLSLVGLRLGECAEILASVCALLLLSAIFARIRTAFQSEGISKAFSFCSTLIITLSILRYSYTCLQSVTDFFTSLNTMTAAVLPLMGALYAMGGNLTVAAATSSGLSIYLTVLEELVGKSILPFCGLCMALALIGAMDPSLRLGTLLSTVKKNYTTALAFLMMLLLAMLSSQSTLGARSDTLLMRSAKFATGNLLPIVGGSVSELLRTVSASVGFLRGTVGICGVLFLLLTLLPTLIEIFLMRLTWQLAASLADLLGCDSEKKLLDEFASLLGYLLSAICICSSVLLLALTLLTHCASAIG